MKIHNFVIVAFFVFASMLVSIINCQSYGAVINVPANFSIIQEAIDAAQSGDIVKVAPGSFDEQVIMKDGVNLEGAGIEVTTISVTAGDFAVKGANNATLSSFTISNSELVGILCDNVNTTIKKCQIKRCGDDGIRCEPAEPGEPEASPTIINNEITSNGDNGISDSSLSTTIKNNVISFNSENGIFADSFTNAAIINNTIHGNGRDGIEPNVPSTAEIRNNIMTSNGGFDIGNQGEPIIDFNVRFDNFITMSIKGPNDIFEDPLFVDAKNGDFRLKPGSSAIDAGDPDPAFDDSDGTRNDIGAFGGPGAGEGPIVTEIIVTPNPIIQGQPISIRATGSVQ